MENMPCSDQCGSEDQYESYLQDDEETFDLEVATVLSQGVRVQDSGMLTPSPCKRFTPAKHSYSPFRLSSALTNITRGNFRTDTPCLQVATLHQMAAQGELLLLQEELREHAVNTCEGNGYTPLVYAAAHNQLRTLEYLLTQGADPNLASNKGETPLHFASVNGYERAVDILIRAGSDVNHKCQRGNTALLYAAHQNQVDCIDVLLSWGADITCPSPEGYSALEVAALQGYKGVQMAIERHLLSLFDTR